MGEPQHRGDQHLQHRDLVLDRVVEEALLEAEAGVVDQQVDGALPVRHPLLDPGQVIGVDEVGPEHLDPHAGRGAEVGRDRLQPRLVAGHEDEVMALLRQLPGELQPDAGGGPGHQRGGAGDRVDGRGMGCGC